MTDAYTFNHRELVLPMNHSVGQRRCVQPRLPGRMMMRRFMCGVHMVHHNATSDEAPASKFQDPLLGACTQAV
jgi:hypothetical protein